MRNTPAFVVLGIHGKAYLNLFLDFLWDVTAFGIYPCRSRAEQSVLRFYRVLTMKWAMHAYVYIFKKHQNTKDSNHRLCKQKRSKEKS